KIVFIGIIKAGSAEPALIDLFLFFFSQALFFNIEYRLFLFGYLMETGIVLSDSQEVILFLSQPLFLSFS
ncbi:hypothetical protein, partial [Chitinophaga sp.]|uniref:hypothetical protein n=1 Tax=Chitinophaga sp. TaxID=1869181 RepID=UPI0031D6DEED